MRTTDTLIIGAGQAGLSLAHHLTVAGQSPTVVERGRIGERWHSERWDSLTLLTPNWLNRLDGGSPHLQPHGFLRRADFAEYLGRYARGTRSPIHENVAVTAVEETHGGFHVDTDAGQWRAGNVVVATGDSADPRIPAIASSAPAWVRQLHSSRYRNPQSLPAGGVLVVGAGPSGQQIAAELRRAGRRVVLSVGRHTRTMRSYRGHDIWHWLQVMGDLDATIDEVPDPVAAVRAPSLTLTGANGGEQLDLAVLDALGVTVAGRLERFTGTCTRFADDLAAMVGDAERRRRRLLDRIDDHIAELSPAVEPGPERAPDVLLPAGPTTIDLAASGITTVIWATGFRRLYPWLDPSVLDAGGEIVHRRGVTPTPGLFILGRRFQHRRASNFIGGVGVDAAFLAGQIVHRSHAGASLTRELAA